MMTRGLLIACAAALALACPAALAGEAASTAVSTNAQTILGQTPAASATTDATNLANDAGSQTSALTALPSTSYPTSTFACGSAYAFTSASNVTAILPGIAGTQPLSPTSGCWIDMYFPTTATNTLTVRTCQIGDEPACGGDHSDKLNSVDSTAGNTSVLIYPTFYGVRFYAYPDGTGSGVWRTAGLPPTYLGTVTGFLASGRTVSSLPVTLAQSDCGTEVNVTASSSGNLTLPNTITGVCIVDIKESGAGLITPTNGSGATVSNVFGLTQTKGAGAIMTVENISGAATWNFHGDLQ